MQTPQYVPLVEVTRGSIVESVHYGAVAVCDASGSLVRSIGDADAVAFLRSSSKPFQVLPLVERGGVQHFKLTERELSVMCASHNGTDEHVQVVSGIQKKLGVTADDLLCGMHTPGDAATAERMFKNNEDNTPLRHNCSGKHTGMLAHCLLRGLSIQDYINPTHPIQKTILETMSEMTGVRVNEIALGTDGCSAPVFAVPLRNAAGAFAQLADPSALPEPRQSALRLIFKAMTSHPDMVAGPGAFDTLLMQIGGGKILTKGGAEGYQAVALLPGACGTDSPALGITIKISDGDLTSRARTTVAMTILRQLGALDDKQLALLKNFTTRPVFNWRHLEVGEIRTAF